MIGRDVSEDFETSETPRKLFHKTNRKKERYSLCVDFSTIREIGSGLAMLFHLKKWIILFQLVILAPALFSLLVNGSRGHASDFEDSGYFAIALSLGNFGKPQSINSSDQNLMYVQSYCHMAALLVILVLSFFFSKSQKDLELRMD